MKRRDLIKLMLKNGWVLVRNGAKHDVYRKDDAMETIPRHKELDEMLAKAIIKRQNLK